MSDIEKKLNDGVIALVGIGSGGLALLKVLLQIPGVKIKYVCDVNPNALGVLYAQEHGIEFVQDYNKIIDDKDINLIFEATGISRVFQDISRTKSPNVSLIGADGSKIIYNLLDSYNEINRNLNEYKINLEKKIIERTEELEKANIRLEKEMMEYEKISHKLQEINDEKTKYLLYATHQLKAPFAAIQSYAEIILEGYTGEIPQRTRDIILKIHERCNLLSNVIKEMLELEKLKSYDIMTASFEKINTYQVLSAAIKKFLITAKAKDVEIVLYAMKDSYLIYGDKVQIEMLFSIFIENAISYSPQNSEIQVIIKEIEENQVYVGVKDEGIGIPEKNLNSIFNEFFRSNNAVEANKNGSGLGLSIAKEIAKIHNTTIKVESTLGKGSCFSVIFPLAVR
jgi:signal transduction histidine kinase